MLRQHARRTFDRYETLNAVHPIKVRGGIGIGLFFVGDLIAQRAQHHTKPEPPALPAAAALEAPAEAARRQHLQSYPQKGAAAAASAVVLPQTALALPPRPAASTEWGYEHWDGRRAAAACSWRAVVWAPTAHYFWLFLETFISPRVAHLGHAGTVVKIVFDFVTIAPPLIFSFLAWNKLWESKGDPNVAIQHASERLPSTLVASYAFWGPLHFMTYGLVPLRHRMVWVSICSVGFGTLLSYFNHR